jgi:SAM-dependent methyltransferase
MRSSVLGAIARWLPLIAFRGSRLYWQERYRLGGDSGAGSGGDAAIYKADVLNAFVTRHGVSTVIEFGCGDGRQLSLADYPFYLGIDVSPDAIRMCRERFQSDRQKEFGMLEEYAGQRADLALSLDVIYHLVEDDVYYRHLDHVFASAERFVVIYSTDAQGASSPLPHVRDRPVTIDVIARFPEFERMDEDTQLPPPIEASRGLATQFFFFRRKVG